MSITLVTGPDLRAVLGHVLAWADTLTDVTARWSHTTSDHLHVTVTGQTAGVRVCVYGAGDFVECGGLVRLDADQRENVSLDELHALVELLRAAPWNRQPRVV